MKTTYLSFFFFIMLNPCSSQSINSDSLTISAQAQTDAKKFHYDKQYKKQVKKNLNNYSSDYFKPTLLYTSDAKLLQDSVYVHSFKFYALKKVKARKTTGLIIIIGSSALVLAFLISLAAATAGLANNL